MTVQVIGDTDLEINETFFVTLSSASANATIADASGTGTITNDDIVITAIGAIQGSGTVAVRFVDNYGVQTERYPFNPNGSPAGITSVRNP